MQCTNQSVCWQAHGETLGEAKPSCKPVLRRPLRPSFLKTAPINLTNWSEAKPSCEKSFEKVWEKCLPGHYTNNFVKNHRIAEISRIHARFSACCRIVDTFPASKYVVQGRYITGKKDSCLYLVYLFRTELSNIAI